MFAETVLIGELQRAAVQGMVVRMTLFVGGRAKMDASDNDGSRLELGKPGLDWAIKDMYK